MNKEKQLHLQLLGASGMNPFIAHNSSQRTVMGTNNLAQRICLSEPSAKRIMSGLEVKYSDYTFDIRMPSDGKIIKTIERYPQTIGANSLSYNPETIVIYEDDKTKVVDSFSIVGHRKFHQHFGFDYKYTDKLNELRTNNFVAKDTIFAHPPSVSENKDFMYGINAKAAFINIPSVAEDGIVVRKGFLDKLKFKVYETRTVEFGLNSYPLNVYGDTSNYKPFPDIGELIREDGVLMALRNYEDSLSPVEMSIYDTREIDYIFDKCLYTRSGVGRVVDVKVYKNPSIVDKIPEIITEFLDKYALAYDKFCKELMSTETSLRMESKRKYGTDKLKIGRNFHKLLTSAYVHLDSLKDKFKQSITLLHRKNVVDQYRVELIIEYVITPGMGYKATDTSGGKGVFCSIVPDEDMPTDVLGRRADVILDPAATINRMNLGRLYEHYINDVLEQVEMRTKNIVGYTEGLSLEEFSLYDKGLLEKGIDYVLGIIELLAPKQYTYLSNLSYSDKVEYLYSVLKEHITVHMPPCVNDSPGEIDLPKTIQHIETTHYKPHIGKITYTGASGKKVTTENNIRLADLYLLLLDKIADDWSSTSVGKLQHFGIISPQNKSEKYRFPFRNSPVRTLGESENRIMVGYTPPENVAELMDRSNNPITMRNTVWNILDAEKPTNIYKLIDREKIPYGSNKPLQMINHLFSVCGFRMKYSKNRRDKK